MEFKDRIKILRTEKDITTTQLANIIEKTDSAIRAWEYGRTKPDCDTLIKLATYFDCTTDYLLGLSEWRNREAKDTAESSQQALMDYLETIPPIHRGGLLHFTHSSTYALHEFLRWGNLGKEFAAFLNCASGSLQYIAFILSALAKAEKELGLDGVDGSILTVKYEVVEHREIMRAAVDGFANEVVAEIEKRIPDEILRNEKEQYAKALEAMKIHLSNPPTED